jgi:hypothetical protein
MRRTETKKSSLCWLNDCFRSTWCFRMTSQKSFAKIEQSECWAIECRMRFMCYDTYWAWIDVYWEMNATVDNRIADDMLSLSDTTNKTSFSVIINDNKCLLLKSINKNAIFFFLISIFNNCHLVRFIQSV